MKIKRRTCLHGHLWGSCCQKWASYDMNGTPVVISSRLGRIVRFPKNTHKFYSGLNGVVKD